MTRKTLHFIALAVMVFVGTMMLSSHADAGTPKSPTCMTKAEWKKVKPGMSRAAVQRIAGTNGRLTSETEAENGDIDQTVDYRQCKSNGRSAHSWNTVSVYYVNYADNPNFWVDENDFSLTMRVPMQTKSKGSWYSIF